MYPPVIRPIYNYIDGSHYQGQSPQSSLQPQQLPNGLRRVRHRLPSQHSSVVAPSLANCRMHQEMDMMRNGSNSIDYEQPPQLIAAERPVQGAGVVINISLNNNGSSEAFPMGNNPERGVTDEKNMLPPDAQIKTPVSVLQEVLSKRGITPTYELVQIEGAIHEPTFRYRVSFNEKDAMGAGKSKKEAKHAAAKSLIEKLSEMNLYPHNAPNPPIQYGSSSDCSGANNESDKQSSSQEDQASGNPIGWLQEQCMIRRWPPPTYETEMEVGLPHQREFTIACAVLKFYEVGQGKSKKIAKRQAAHKMWLTLQQCPVDGAGPGDGAAGNDEENRVTNRYGDLKDAHIPTLTNQHSYKVSQFHKTMKANCGRNLAALQTTCLNSDRLNYVQFLHSIASEHQFEVTYVDIEEKTYQGRQQCLVQLSTLPVAVCHGSGETSNEAQASAARNALEYLKIMTKM